MNKKISIEKIAFLKFELENGGARRVKIALQDLSFLYRHGYFLSSVELNDFERAINGIVLRDNQDEKVVRWCLNAIAQIGRRVNCEGYVLATLRRHEGKPEIQAAGIAALSRLYCGQVQDIELLGAFDPNFWKLAALQNTDPRAVQC